MYIEKMTWCHDHGGIIGWMRGNVPRELENQNIWEDSVYLHFSESGFFVFVQQRFNMAILLLCVFWFHFVYQVVLFGSIIGVVWKRCYCCSLKASVYCLCSQNFVPTCFCHLCICSRSVLNMVGLPCVTIMQVLSLTWEVRIWRSFKCVCDSQSVSSVELGSLWCLWELQTGFSDRVLYICAEYLICTQRLTELQT